MNRLVTVGDKGPSLMAMESDETDSTSWPHKSHDLRGSTGNGRSHAFLDWQEGIQGRVMGYRRAAEILAAEMLSTSQPRDLDTVVFPFAACWRHYVELQLKALIADLQRLLDLPQQRRGGHDIQQLWSELRPLLVRSFPAEERRDRSVVGRLLRQLAELDPDNQDFRYRERRDGTPTLPGVKHLDIGLFHEAMLEVANYLEAIDSAIDHDHDLKNDALQMAWEAQHEFEQDMSDEYRYEG